MIPEQNIMSDKQRGILMIPEQNNMIDKQAEKNIEKDQKDN